MVDHFFVRVTLQQLQATLNPGCQKITNSSQLSVPLMKTNLRGVLKKILTNIKLG